MFGIRRDDDQPPAATCAGCGGAVDPARLLWRRSDDGAVRAGFLADAGAAPCVWHLACLEPAARPACARSRTPRRRVARPACLGIPAPAHPLAAIPCHRAPGVDRRSRAARRPQPR